jgi:hypothetical protein
MPLTTIKRRLASTRDGELANDDGPSFSTVGQLGDALQRAIPQSRDLGLKEEALRSGVNWRAGLSTRSSDDR